MNQQDLWVHNRYGEKLEALLRKLKTSGNFPAVLLISGLGMDLHESNNSFDEISKLLVKSGYSTLQFSFAGCGKSQGKYVEMTFERQARQIEDIIAWMLSQSIIDSNRIGIIAQSCGAPSTLLADVSQVKPLFFISGAFNTYANLKRKFIEKKAYNPTGLSNYPRSNGKTDPIGPNFWNDLEKLDESNLAQKIRSPVFIATGTNDSYVNTQDARNIYNFFPNPLKRIKIYNDGDHGLENPEPVRKELLRDIVNWFQKTL